MVTKPVYVYRLYDVENNLLYIGATSNIRTRVMEHRVGLKWGHRVHHAEHESFPNRHLALLAEGAAIKAERPPCNGRWCYNHGSASRDGVNPDDYKPASLNENITAEAIKALRTSLGLSQGAFAYRLGVPMGTVCKWEWGQSKPDAANIYHLRQLQEEETHGEG